MPVQLGPSSGTPDSCDIRESVASIARPSSSVSANPAVKKLTAPTSASIHSANVSIANRLGVFTTT